MSLHPRPVVLKDREVFTDTATIRQALAGLGAVSAIDIKLRATTGATSKQGVYIHDDVDTIDVKDGSDILYSLNGIESQALTCYHNHKMPAAIFREGAAVVEEETFTVHFGRFLGDERYWLDTDQYRNPLLELALTLAISATAGFATGTGRVSIVAWIWDEKPAVREGVLISKEYKEFTSLASGDDLTELPIDLPHRLLLVRAYEANVLYETDITQILLRANRGGKILLNMEPEMVRDIARQRYGSFSYGVELFRTDADTVDTFLHLIDSVALQALQDLDIATIDARLANRLTLQLLTLAVTPTIAKSTTDRAIDAVVHGFIPFGTLPLLIADPDDPDDWLDPGQYNNMQLVLTQGGAAATVQVFGQQVMR